MPEVVVENPDDDWERRRVDGDELNVNDEKDNTAFNPAPPRRQGVRGYLPRAARNVARCWEESQN